jgi:hypothetical protein
MPVPAYGIAGINIRESCASLTLIEYAAYQALVSVLILSLPTFCIVVAASLIFFNGKMQFCFTILFFLISHAYALSGAM